MCAHVGALLYVASEIVSGGYADQGSCTDCPCRWVERQPSEVPPSRLQDINIASSSRHHRRFASFHEIETEAGRKLREEAVETMFHDLRFEPRDKQVGLKLLHLIRFMDHNTRNRVPPCPQSLPHMAMDFHAGITHAYEVEVETNPPNLLDIPHQKLTTGSGHNYYIQAAHAGLWILQSGYMMMLWYHRLKKIPGAMEKCGVVPTEERICWGIKIHRNSKSN